MLCNHLLLISGLFCIAAASTALHYRYRSMVFTRQNDIIYHRRVAAGPTLSELKAIPGAGLLEIRLVTGKF